MAEQRRGCAARRVFIVVCSILVPVLWTLGAPAQTSPRAAAELSQAAAPASASGDRAEFVPLHYGGHFVGDLRHLPDTPAGDHAHHPLLPRPALDRLTQPDPAHQAGGFVAPAPEGRCSGEL